MPDSFLKRVVDSFEERSEKVAMRIVGDDSHIYTFGESLRRARAIAYRLGQEGIGPGDRVALIGENHPNWAIAYLGILYRGAVCVPLDPQGEMGTLANFIENSEAKLVFIGEEVREKFQQIEERLGRKLSVAIWRHESEPGAVRGPREGIPSGVQDATGSPDLGLRNADFGFADSITANPQSQIPDPQSGDPVATAPGSDSRRQFDGIERAPVQQTLSRGRTS